MPAIYNDQVIYIKEKNITKKRNFVEYNIFECGRKPYMDWETITDHNSIQWQYQMQAHTDWTGIRKVGDRYCIAVGSAFTNKVGTKLDLVMEDGSVVKCILGDCKQDRHTDASNIYAVDGSVAEFIVNTSSLNSQSRLNGDVSHACDELKNRVVQIKVYK